jgi:dihydrofolate reductase
MIIVTRGVGVRPQGCFVTGSVQSALALARERGETEVFVIGGGEIYRQTIDLADRVYLTRVHADVGADVFFPEISTGAWTEMQRVDLPADEKNQYATTFTVLERHR